MSQEIKWTPAQRAAIDVRGKRVLVSAAAGSGKSTVLTERIISSITDPYMPKDINRLMVVTFTRASAEDLKNKITKAIRNAVTVAPSNRRLSEQLIKLPSAKINTIHGVCFSLIKSHFDTLGIPASVSIADETVISSVKLSTMNKLIDDCYNGAFANTNEFTDFAENFVTDSDVSLADKLLDIYSIIKNQPDGFTLNYDNAYNISSTEFLNSGFGEAICRRILVTVDYYKAVFIKALNYFEQNPTYSVLTESFCEALQYIENIENLCRNGGNAEELAKLLSERPKASTARTKEKTDIGEHFRAERKNFNTEMKSFYDKTLSFFDNENSAELLESSKKATENLHQTVFSILSEFERRFTEVKLKRSVIDFNDIEHYALKLLYEEDGSVSDAAKELSSSLDEIYVDEYQDLNPLQNKIFNALSVNCPIFMVGDIKQSIYGFRGADPYAFGEYKKSFPELDISSQPDKAREYEDVTVFLSNNFRSDFSVTEFSNAVSDALFISPDSDLYSYRIPYTTGDRLVWSKDGDKSDAEDVTLINCEPEESENDEKTSTFYLEAENVANEISRLIRSGVKASDIAILLRNAKLPAPVFEKALKARGIATASEKGTKLFDMPEIQLALCILNCCDNPYRDIFITGALRSPVFGLTLDELIRIKKSYPRTPSFYEALICYTEENSFEKGKAFIEFINKMRKLSTTLTVDRLLWQIYTETSFFSIIYDGGKIDEASASARRSNLIRLHELAKSYASSSQNGLYGFLEKVKLLIDNKNAPSAATTNGDAVTLMTVHSSKGLEFEYCFLCGASHTLECKDEREKIIFEHKVGIGAVIKSSDNFTSFETPYHMALKHSLHLAYFDEEMRMLYVALTRARKKLYVSSQIKDFDKAINDAKLNGTVPHYYTYIRKASYIHWILTALATESDIKPKYSIVNKTQTEVLTESENIINAERNIKTDTVKLNNDEKDKLYNETKAKISFVYPYLSSLKLPSKLSVSRLYPEILDEDVYFGVKPIFEEDNAQTETDNTSLLKAPDFTLSSKQVSGAERGTATHVFMQFCDFKMLEENGIESEIKRLTEKRFILKEHANMIDKAAINRFLLSNCFNMIKNATEINREYRFNIKLNASSFTSNSDLKAELINDFVFVQGIIDCYLRDKNGDIILLDYKTDAVPKSLLGNRDAENAFFNERHGEQLHYYSTALKLLTGKDVKRAYIYSFALNRMIEIPT